MLDDLKSTDNVVRSAVILKVLGKMVGGVGVKSPGVKIEISQEALAVRRSAAHAPVRISNFDCSGKIATSRTTIVGTVAASVRLAMWAMGPRVGEGQNAQITRLGGQIS